MRLYEREDFLAPGLNGNELTRSLALHGINCIGMRICGAAELARLALMRSGISISEDNDFCGGVYGCQAEVGCASAMAAGALTVLAGGTTGQAMNAASMALQNMLGLICDPVCGLVQVPCFSRNMGGIANAVVCANMSLLGFDGVMHLQDAFEAMKSSGRCFPTGLKGCGGGLCDTPTGRELLARFSKA